MIAGVVSAAVRRCEYHGFGDVMCALDGSEIVNRIYLFCKSQKPTALAVIFFDCIIPNAGNTALVRQ